MQPYGEGNIEEDGGVDRKGASDHEEPCHGAVVVEEGVNIDGKRWEFSEEG